jgi:release factor glutamine methyltransferase
MARVPSAPLAAELLLLHLLDRDRSWLYAHPDEIIGESDLAEYDMLLKRRVEGVPVQYLTGEQEFWGLDFEVNPDVLIPRPETEHLIEAALERMGRRRNDPLFIADVGTGSGCIAVALAREFPASEIVATDISAAALEVAGRNTVRHGVQSRVELIQANLLEPYLAPKSARIEHFDLIVSNPPYVGRAEQPSLQREVVEHEPHQALFAGEYGLNVYPELISQAATLLKPGGVLVLELGHGQSERVRTMVAEDGSWGLVSVTNDLAGIPRVLAAERISA